MNDGVMKNYSDFSGKREPMRCRACRSRRDSNSRGTDSPTRTGAGSDARGRLRNVRRTAVEWVGRIAEDKGYDPEIEPQATVAGILDAIYGRG